MADDERRAEIEAPERIWTNAHAGSILTGTERLAEEMRALGDTLVEYVRADRVRDARGDDEAERTCPECGPNYIWPDTPEHCSNCGGPTAARSPQSEDHEAARLNAATEWLAHGPMVTEGYRACRDAAIDLLAALPSPSRDGTVAVEEAER